MQITRSMPDISQANTIFQHSPNHPEKEIHSYHHLHEPFVTKIPRSRPEERRENPVRTFRVASPEITSTPEREKLSHDVVSVTSYSSGGRVHRTGLAIVHTGGTPTPVPPRQDILSNYHLTISSKKPHTDDPANGGIPVVNNIASGDFQT